VSSAAGEQDNRNIPTKKVAEHICHCRIHIGRTWRGEGAIDVERDGAIYTLIGISYTADDRLSVVDTTL
jgi:hypothetical protein